MRPKVVSAAVLALVGVVLALPAPVAADGMKEPRAASHHAHRYVARHAYHYKVDPYAWHFSPRGYYPYYNSGYWAPASYIKWRNREHLNVWKEQPPRFRYYKAWGYPRKHWDHHAWHAEQHGRHYPWHW